MKKSYIKKMAAFVVAAAMTLALAACGSTSAAPAAESAGSAESTAEAGSGKLAKIQEKGKLVVCTDAAWAPFEYIGKDGEVTGVDIEIGKYIAEKLGVKLEISNVAFDSISTYLDNGEADLALACITVTDERKETMDFSEPYTTVLQYMVVLADDEETKTINDLAGKAVGTHLGTTGDFLMSDEITAGVLEGTGAENKQYKALPDAALAIKSGELTCLLGQNGIGKSTLLRTLSAFQPKLGGSVQVHGREIADYTDKELSKMIGVVLTEKPDVQNMTVTELVGMGRSPYTGFWGTLTPADKQIVSESISLVAIEQLKDRMVHTLSDGERQKVMIAKALAQQTPVIYLDEPTAFLDFPSKVETMQLLLSLCHDMQKTVFLSTHDVEIAIQMADSCWVMGDGCLHIGTPRELANQGVISKFVERPGVVFDKENLSIRIKSM